MTLTRCTVCNAAAATLCSTCKSTAFCSTKCAKDGERVHKLLCEKFVAFTANPRPTPSSVLALFFPLLKPGIKASGAELIWFDKGKKVEKGSDGSIKLTDVLVEGIVLDKDIAGQLEEGASYKRGGHEIVHREAMDISVNYAQGFKLDHTLQFYMRHEFRSDGSRVNLSILETTVGEQKDLWRGPSVVYSEAGIYRPLHCVDVTVADLHHMVDYFTKYGPGLGHFLSQGSLVELEITNAPLFNSIMLKNSTARRVNGVDITCVGDHHFIQADKFISVQVPTNHPIFHHQDAYLAPISELLGLPLLLRKALPVPRWWDKATNVTFMPSKNPAAMYLNMVTDTANEKFGLAPDPTWEEDVVGRVLVVRKDMLDITPNQVEALVNFCRYKISPDIEKQREGLIGLTDKQKKRKRAALVKFWVCQEKFDKFFEDLKKAKQSGGYSSWKEEVSPFSSTVGDLSKQLAGLSVREAETASE